MVCPPARNLDELRGSDPDFQRFAGAFDVLTDARLNEYQAALPTEWVGDGSDVGRILDYVRALKQNMNVAINNLIDALR
jgi:hypothetical protein